MPAPGSDRIPVELLQILTQYAICRLPALCHKVGTSEVRGKVEAGPHLAGAGTAE